MADRFFDIEIEGEEKLFLALKRVEEKNQRMARDLVEDMTQVGAFWLIAFVPQYSSYIMNHIDRSGPTWFPGGPGGGGEWRGIVGIKAGASKHPLYVEFGTGVYAGKGKIYPRKPGGVLAFRKQGEEEGKAIFRKWIWGQPGQHYFYQTWRVLQAHMAARLARERMI